MLIFSEYPNQEVYYVYICTVWWRMDLQIRVITKLPNSEQSSKGKVKTHNYINRQNQSTKDTITRC
jgi:hypothetical protein